MMWTAFLTELQNTGGQYDKWKLAWMLSPLIWYSPLFILDGIVAPVTLEDVVVPICSIFGMIVMFVTFRMIKGRVDAAKEELMSRWVPCFRNSGLTLSYRARTVTSGRKNKQTTYTWYEITLRNEVRPKLYEIARDKGVGYETTPAPAAAAVQMQQIQVTVPPGGASQPLLGTVLEVVPPLPTMVDIFKRDLGIDDKLNIKEVVDRACAELGVDTQGPLIQRAQECWKMLSSPPGVEAGAADHAAQPRSPRTKRGETQPQTTTTTTGPLREGDRIEARFRRREKYYPGRIRTDRGDGTYFVNYDDGTSEARVRGDMIRKV